MAGKPERPTVAERFRDVTLQGEVARLRAALEQQIRLWESLPCGVDYEADENNTSPADAAAHIAGLAVRAAQEALER